MRAVFLAAGTGSRLLPLTMTTPKPLLAVNGVRIIDTLLNAVVAAGIDEIYVVRGYLAEQFDVLRHKYPVRFIDNADYATANNIGSVVAAGDLLADAYVIESDLCLRNPSLITSTPRESHYLAIAVPRSDDWCFDVDANGCITRIGVGCERPCQQLVGISYWTRDDGLRLAQRARELYADPANRQMYWDEIALDRFLPEFRVRTRLCAADDVVEIDTCAELCALDSSYRHPPQSREEVSS